MLLPKCPSCRARLATDEIPVCACGFDLAAERTEMERWMRPYPGATVLPISVMRKLSPQSRREVSQAIERTRASEREKP